jgi:hypothetical protein
MPATNCHHSGSGTYRTPEVPERAWQVMQLQRQASPIRVFSHRRIALAVMPVRSRRHPSTSSPIAVYLPRTAERARLLICSKANDSRCRDGALPFFRHHATHRFAASGQCQFNSPPWYSKSPCRMVTPGNRARRCRTNTEEHSTTVRRLELGQIDPTLAGWLNLSRTNNHGAQLSCRAFACRRTKAR